MRFICVIINSEVVNMLKRAGRFAVFEPMIGVILSAVGGFALSGSSIGGVASFADISLCGAFPLPYSAAAFIGAVMRGILSDSVGRNIVKLAAMTMIIAAKMFMERKNSPTLCGVITAVSIFISGAAVSVLIGEFSEKLLFYAFYGAIGGFTASSLNRLAASLKDKKVIDLSGASGCAYGIVYIVFTASLCSIKFDAVNPGIISGAAFTLGAAFFYQSLGGIVVGALSAAGALFASAELGTTAAMLPLAGFLVGFLSRRRIVFSALFFAFSCFMLCVLTGSAAEMQMTLSIICGVSLFVAAAPHYSDKWISATESSGSDQADINASKKNFLSDIIEAVRLDSGRIAAALATVHKHEGSYTDQVKKICGDCYRRSICRLDYESAEEIMPILPEDCSNRQKIAEELEKNMRGRIADQLMRLRFSDDRELLNEQLKIMGELVRSTAERTDMRFSASKSRDVFEYLRAHGIKPLRVEAYYNSANRLIAEIYFEISEIPESAERICDLASDCLDIKMISSPKVNSAKEMRVSLYEATAYDTEIFTAGSRAAEVSGDSTAVFSDGEGVKYIVLSDGMGTGKNAAVDSHMVIGMFRKLICGGMEFASAVRLINSVMVTKSREESFATFDSVRLDLDKCVMTSIKSGAASTIIKRNGDVIKISAPTFPIGITGQAEIYTTQYDLKEDDIIIMFSDGIGENAHLFIKELLLGSSDIKEIVRSIAKKASVFNSSSRPDDVTVIGIKIKHK